MGEKTRIGVNKKLKTDCTGAAGMMAAVNENIFTLEGTTLMSKRAKSTSLEEFGLAVSTAGAKTAAPHGRYNIPLLNAVTQSRDQIISVPSLEILETTVLDETVTIHNAYQTLSSIRKCENAIDAITFYTTDSRDRIQTAATNLHTKLMGSVLSGDRQTAQFLVNNYASKRAQTVEFHANNVKNVKSFFLTYLAMAMNIMINMNNMAGCDGSHGCFGCVSQALTIGDKGEFSLLTGLEQRIFDIFIGTPLLYVPITYISSAAYHPLRQVLENRICLGIWGRADQAHQQIPERPFVGSIGRPVYYGAGNLIFSSPAGAHSVVWNCAKYLENIGTQFGIEPMTNNVLSYPSSPHAQRMHLRQY
ncbi:hypothetical protein DFJ77DRAFT_513987 [Powellomyces hirtus]|nr:hypothetical protein DFJ77DRAFT_513987 [Powellomyces hirtus]